MKALNTAAGQPGAQEKGIIDVSSGICPIGPSKKVKAAIRKAIKGIQHRPDAAITRLEKLFASKFGLAHDRILLANSVRELFCLVIRALGPKRVLIVGPALGFYEDAASRSGAEICHFAAREGSEFAIEADRLVGDFDGVELMFIANPNRVTGRLIDMAVLSRIVEGAVRRKLRVVIDESLMEFTGQDGFVRAAAGEENVIVIRTTANFFGLPGLELAYAVSGVSAIRQLAKKNDCSQNILAVEAARTALKDETYRKLVLRFIAEEKTLLSNGLEKAGGVTCFGSDSNVYLVKLGRREEKMPDSFLRAGFLIRDCSDIAGLGSSFLRLSVMGHDKNLKLLRLLKTLLPPTGPVAG